MEVAVAVAAAATAAAAVPPTWVIQMFLDLFKKTHPPHLFCPDTPFSKSSLKVAIG